MRSALVIARKSAGLTQADVAKKAGILRASYAHIERGTRDPSIDVALRIAQTVGCSVEDIFLPSNVSERRKKMSTSDSA